MEVPIVVITNTPAVAAVIGCPDELRVGIEIAGQPIQCGAGLSDHTRLPPGDVAITEFQRRCSPEVHEAWMVIGQLAS